MAPHLRWAIDAKECGVGLDFGNELANVVVESLAKRGTDSCIASGGSLEFEARLGMEAGAHYKPTILRTSAIT